MKRSEPTPVGGIWEGKIVDLGPLTASGCSHPREMEVLQTWRLGNIRGDAICCGKCGVQLRVLSVQPVDGGDAM